MGTDSVTNRLYLTGKYQMLVFCTQAKKRGENPSPADNLGQGLSGNLTHRCTRASRKAPKARVTANEKIRCSILQEAINTAEKQSVGWRGMA